MYKRYIVTCIQSRKLQTHLPHNPTKHTPPSNLPLLGIRAPRQRTRTINHLLVRHAHHTHLGHGRHKRRVPRGLANAEPGKSQRRCRVGGNVLVGGKHKGRGALLRLAVVFDVPDAWGRVEAGAGFGAVDELLGCGRVGADEGGEVDGGEAFGCCDGTFC